MSSFFSRKLRFPIFLQLLLVVTVLLSLHFLILVFIENPLLESQLSDRYQDRGRERADILAGAISKSLQPNTSFPINQFHEFSSVKSVTDAIATDCSGNVLVSKNSLLTGNNILSSPIFSISTNLGSLDRDLYKHVATTGAAASRNINGATRYELRSIPCLEPEGQPYAHGVAILFFDWSYLIDGDIALVDNILLVEQIKWLVLICIAVITAAITIRPRVSKLKKVLNAASQGDFSARYGKRDIDEIDLIGQSFDKAMVSFESVIAHGQGLLDKQAIGRKAFEESNQAICIFSADQRVIDVNSGYTELTGYTRNEIIGRSMLSLLPQELAETCTGDLVDKNLTDGEEREVWDHRKDGSRIRKMVRLSNRENSLGQIENFFYTERDISKQYEQRIKLGLIANTDSLTGIPNRRQFNEDLKQFFYERESQFAVGIFDLDNMQEINSEYGTQVGDRLIRETARRLLLALAGTKYRAYRVEGDEFLLIFKDIVSERDLERRANAILASVCGETEINGWQIDLTARMGVALFDRTMHGDPDTILRDADTALQHGKNTDHSNLVIAQDYVLATQRRRSRMSLALKSPKLTQQLGLLYSPKIDIRHGTLSGAESSVNWHCHQLGFVPYEELMETAERAGEIIKIGNWVTDQTLTDAATFCAHLSGFQTTLRISAKQLVSPAFTEQFIDLLRTNGVATESIVLDLTHWEKFSDSDTALKILETLRSIGISIQVSDFNISFSSFSGLKPLPIDIVKINQLSIKNIENDITSRKAVREFISQAHAMNMEVIVEGVDNSKQYKILRDLDCDYCHGYLYSEPTSLVDGDTVTTVIDNWQKTIDTVLS